MKWYLQAPAALGAGILLFITLGFVHDSIQDGFWKELLFSNSVFGPLLFGLLLLKFVLKAKDKKTYLLYLGLVCLLVLVVIGLFELAFQAERGHV